jgi:ubiquinone/menaquinone biosynthesis C-methylase UbiE
MKAFRQKTRKLALQVGLPLAAVTACGAMLLPFIIPALLGQSYDPAVPAAQLLLLGSAIWLGFFWLKPVYFAHGAIKQWSLVIGTFSLATLVGWLLIVPFYGFIGMSIWWTTSVALVYVGLGVSVYYVQFADSRLIPDWDEYTSQLVLKRAITGTNVDLLKNYARGKVLDAGCGTGIRLNQVATWSGVELAVGVDIGMPGLHYAKQNFPTISLICASVYNLPFKDEQFDFIYSIDVVEHLDDPRTALKEFYRVCKTNATKLINSPKTQSHTMNTIQIILCIMRSLAIFVLIVQRLHPKSYILLFLSHSLQAVLGDQSCRVNKAQYQQLLGHRLAGLPKHSPHA